MRGWKFVPLFPPTRETPVYVHGELVPGAFHSSQDGSTLIFLRPVVEALGYEVEATGLTAKLEDDAGKTLTVPFQKTPEGRAILPVRELCKRLGLASPIWDGEAVRIQ
jgi:hypothetical protein